jgi:4-hydroxy-L-threonine phosphate dehydrogenase PdxA
MTQPLIAVTMGDPAGIGPEIIARAFGEEDFRKHNRAIVVGDAGILERATRLLDLALRANVVAEPEDARFEPGTVDVISETELPGDLPFGELDVRAGDAAFRYVERATGLASEGRVGAIATAPLNK